MYAHKSILQTLQRIGRRAPLHTTGVGKNLLLNFAQKALNRLIDEIELTAFTKHTITTKDKLLTELEHICSRGYAIDGEECENGVRCVATKSHGNAIGMGFADIITRKVFDKIDFQATYENVLTNSFLDRGFSPVVVEDLHSGYEFAIRHCGLADPANPKIIRIKNTLALDHMWVSQKVLEEIQNRDNIEVTDKIRELFAGNDDSFNGKEFS